jgi:heme exporter protein D
VAALGPHAGFIAAAYCVAAVVVIGLILWVIVDGRAVRRRIAAIEAAGVRRTRKSQP